MTDILDKHWFTEFCHENGSAFSYQIKQKLHSEQTPYQHIDIYETTHFGNLMVIDNYIMLTSHDHFFYHEMMAHVPLFTHSHPQELVIIGGGDCGTLCEVLKHASLTHIYQIEIDARVTELSAQFFPELTAYQTDPRVSLLFTDGIQWMQQATPASIDVIIVDSTDPIGPAKGLFNADFYRSCWNALRPGGILIVQGESPLIHAEFISVIQQNMQTAGFSHRHVISFPAPCYPLGWWSASIAGKNQPVAEFRCKAAKLAAFNTRYYNSDIHQAALAIPNFLQQKLPGD